MKVVSADGGVDELPPVMAVSGKGKEKTAAKDETSKGKEKGKGKGEKGKGKATVASLHFHALPSTRTNYVVLHLPARVSEDVDQPPRPTSVLT